MKKSYRNSLSQHTKLRFLEKLVGIFHTPTHGKAAVYIWETLSGNKYPFQRAKEIYFSMGYIPFFGYPLKRKNDFQ
jgi:hypothetical protein